MRRERGALWWLAWFFLFGIWRALARVVIAWWVWPRCFWLGHKLEANPHNWSFVRCEDCRDEIYVGKPW